MRFLSLFSGIEAASVAWHPLGFEPVAFSEIEPFPCSLLSERFPTVPNLGDITKITETTIKKLGRIDIVVFGSPCQDLSLAGKRQGFEGNRSSLFYDAVRIIKWAKKHGGSRFALWENVPGAFSSNKGGDFSEVLRLLTGSRQHQPEKWRNAGIAFGKEGLTEWRVLDAQHFGVPQRRRRIFALADFGNWTDRQPILFEPKSLCRDSQTSGKKREDVTGPLESRSTAGGFPGTDGACSGHVVPCWWDGGQTSQTLDAVLHKGQTMPEKNRFPAVLENISLTHNGKSGSPICVSEKTMVRRLTPVECERLQGFPDNWTKISWRKKPADNCPDGPRYKAIGNSMAVPVMRWLGQRIMMAIQDIDHGEKEQNRNC